MNKSSRSSKGQASGSGGKGPSQYSMVKDGWGNQNNFNASYGLKPTPDGYEEGNRIAQAMLQADRDNAYSTGKKSG